jgi:probable F420-dependent oxidoreductase
MRYGFALPKSTDGAELIRFASAVEDFGYESVWVGDHIVLPKEETDQYPYTPDGRFVSRPDDPQLDAFIVLSYIASATSTIDIGTTVAIVPYRNPILQAKMFATLDVLTDGRAVCGVGVGWLEKEFDVLGASYPDRGPVTDEYLQIFKALWTEQDPEFHGEHYDFDGIYFAPKPVRDGHIPIWVGGHTRRAVRRTVKYGDAWHPTRQTPEFVARHLPYMREYSESVGRDPSELTMSLKRTLHFTDIGIDEGPANRSNGALIASTGEVIEDVQSCIEIGIDQLTFDFRTSNVDDCIRTMEHFATMVAPAV